MGQEGTPDAPVYRKVKQDDGAATTFYFIDVDEGWRSWILCADMYEWAADQLIEKLAGTGGWQHGGETQ